jgi:small subunit ribosomal protein S16
MTARPLEILGTYQPIPIVLPPPSLSPNGSIRGTEWGPRQSKREAATQEVGEKRVEWNESRVRWWLERGAEPSKRVERLLISAGILSEYLASFFFASLRTSP